MNQEPHAILFGDALPTQGVAVQVRFGANGLELVARDGSLYRPTYSELTVQPGGWRGDALLFEWNDAGAVRSLTLSHPERLAGAEEHLPRPMRLQLESWRASARRHAVWLRVGIVVALAVVLLPLVGFGVLFVNGERLAGYAAKRVPVAWETEAAEYAARQIQADEALLPDGVAAHVVEEIGARLIAVTDTPYSYRFFVVRNDQANAFAMPGGTIVVWSGLLLEVESAEELAGVLAHEIQHAEQRHSTRALLHSLGIRVTLSTILGGTGSVANLLGETAVRLTEMRFSRTQEVDADAKAVPMMARAGIDPNGLAAFFENLARTHRPPPAFVSTHPASRERAAAVRALIPAGGVYERLPYDWEAVRRSLTDAT